MRPFFTQDEEHRIKVVNQFENEVAVGQICYEHSIEIGSIIAGLTSKTEVRVENEDVANDLNKKEKGNHTNCSFMNSKVELTAKTIAELMTICIKL